jgi:hypothetical protein
METGGLLVDSEPVLGMTVLFLVALGASVGAVTHGARDFAGSNGFCGRRRFDTILKRKRALLWTIVRKKPVRDWRNSHFPAPTTENVRIRNCEPVALFDFAVLEVFHRTKRVL